MKTIIFACIHNAGRSQMAAAFFNQLSDSEKIRAVSAGTEPADHVHPEVQQVMSELGIDLSQAKPQKLTEELAQKSVLLVTMGCGEKCPFVPGLEILDWPLLDPKGQSLDQVRQTRDEIKIKINKLITERNWR